jgi:glutamine synthetase adenylyltransferase
MGQELHKYTDNDVERSTLENAIEKVSRVTHEINEKRRDTESRRKVFEVSTLVQDHIQVSAEPCALPYHNELIGKLW